VLDLKVQPIRSYRSADRGLCWIIPALVEGNCTVLVSAYGPSRRVAARALRRAKATECVNGVDIRHVDPTLLGWPVEQVEWVNRTRKRADTRNEEARKYSANVPTGQSYSLRK
jgi:hypothetical protein